MIRIDAEETARGVVGNEDAELFLVSASIDATGDYIDVVALLEQPVFDSGEDFAEVMSRTAQGKWWHRGVNILSIERRARGVSLSSAR